MVTFYAKNMIGEIKEITYIKDKEISMSLIQAFGDTPLYEPVWIDDEGYEFVVPRNGQTLLILYRYIPVNVKFIHEWTCYRETELDEEILKKYYEEYTLLIESKCMQYLYEEISIFFYYNENDQNFYLSANMNVIEEDYGGHIKQISISSDAISFSSIKDLFLSYRHKYEHIPEGFFYHLAECSEKSWQDL
jgi:hypothetical protein